MMARIVSGAVLCVVAVLVARVRVRATVALLHVEPHGVRRARRRGPGSRSRSDRCRFPPVVDLPQIVVSTGPNQVDRRVQPLGVAAANNISRAVAENLVDCSARRACRCSSSRSTPTPIIAWRSKCRLRIGAGRGRDAQCGVDRAPHARTAKSDTGRTTYASRPPDKGLRSARRRAQPRALE
jgi:hypothetical protein